MTQSQNKILFLSHGGGPLPLLGDENHEEMIATLQDIVKQVDKPKAIIVISAHWEEAKPHITAAVNPSLIYDYYGFPPEAYEIKYPVSGNPQLAESVYAALRNSGIAAELDETRGFDHGVYVPLSIMYPDADIPCVQLSLLNNLSASAHIQMGEALSMLNEQEVLIIGSGFSFHNLRAFFSPSSQQEQQAIAQFEAWLTNTLGDTEIDESDRKEKLRHWDQAPAARFCHPREEHLLPLFVCYGIAKRACPQIFHLNILGRQASMFLW